MSVKTQYESVVSYSEGESKMTARRIHPSESLAIKHCHEEIKMKIKPVRTHVWRVKIANGVETYRTCVFQLVKE